MEEEFDPFEVELIDESQAMLSEDQIDMLIEVGRERLDTGDEATGGLWLVDDDPEMERRKLEGVQAFQRRLRSERIKRQDRFVNLLAGGYTIDECCWHINITKSTYHRWRSEDHDYRDETTRAQREGQILLQGLSPENAHTTPFHILRKRCFGRDTFGYQQKIIDIIENAPIGEMTMILLPPGVGKTMTIEDWLTLELAKDQTIRCMYISESGDLGERTMAVIKERFENTSGEYDNLAALFGPLYDEDSKKPWRATAIRMPGSEVGLRDYSLRTRGMRSQITSIRADIIIMDDIQTRNTLGRTETFLRDIRGTILTRREGAIQGKVIFIGTRLELGDLAERLIVEGVVLEDNLYVMPLINTDGKSNFEEIIPNKSLPILVRQMGDQFQALYQQNPAGGRSNTFGDAITSALDRNYTVNSFRTAHEQTGEEQELLGRIVSIDPALTGGNATIAMGWSMTDLWIYDLDIKFDTHKMSYAENMIEWFILTYEADVLVVEDKAYQKALLTSERIEQICSTYGVKIVKHTTGAEKHDKVFGVAKMETPMAFGRIHIPWGDEYSMSRMRPLRDQLRVWRDDLPTKAITQDAIMALWFGHTYVFQQRAIAASRLRAEETIERSRRIHGPSRRGLPYGKTTAFRRHH